MRTGADRIGGSIDDAIAPPAVHFLGQRYTLYVGSLDEHGRPWASQLTGPPGFVAVRGGRSVHVAASPFAGDPLGENVRAHPHVGLLAIDLVTRRRFRVNGTATPATDGGIDVAVVQAYGNCPKYIQRREPAAVVDPAPDATAQVTRHAALTPAMQERLARTDTFFLATAHPTAGADVSHRGGTPGFVQVLDARRVCWPDYAGNMMFMSLGNIAANPRAGLLVVDFESGDVLQLTGTARIDWDATRARAVPGAQRLIDFDVEAVVDAPAASPLRWRLVEPSPFNP